LIGALVTLAFVFPCRAPGQVAPSAASLRVVGKVAKPLTLHDADLAQLPRKHLEVTDEKGHPVAYDGVAVAEILRRAGVPLGERLRGRQMKLFVVVNAADRYGVVLAIPELDADFNDRVLIIADRRDGHPIAPPEGPFRLVVQGEKHHARWVREVTTLDVEEAR
jgi:DMSO/TMAO reductase YedYZ molybdopterin-dependent catalytic subunit